MTGQPADPGPATEPGAAEPGSAGLAAARARLGQAQRGLVAALVGQGAAPPGFAADRVAATAQALRRKRTREIAAAWPALAGTLGERFAAEVAGALGGRPPAGALTDGWLVARALARAGRLPAAARAELAATTAAHRLRAGRLVPRRGAGLHVTRAAGRPALAVRVGHRVWWFPGLS